MIKRYTFLFAALLSCSTMISAQSGCPGCLVELPNLPEDTIFLTAAPDGQAGQYYTADISFRMPKTTTPVAATDPDVPPGLTIQQITISSVTNVPPGLSWEANQTQFTPSEQTDGCVRFCGTPLLPGYYEVGVIVTAQILFISQTTSFTFPIQILPAVSQTDGFSIINSTACGNLTASFVNNVPSNGADGFSYFWNFGNGQTSLDENPLDRQYNEPGTYVVDYQAIVDTSGFFLTNVRIESVTCTDLLNGPDLKIRIFDQQNNELYISPIVPNAITPLDFSVNLSLDTGNYRLSVTDDDGGIDGADDDCGSVNFNRFTVGQLLATGMSASVTILHPVDTIRASDTIVVYPQPSPPLVFGVPAGVLCEGDELTLETDFDESVQWYRDSVPLFEGMLPELTVSESGSYWVVYTSPDGCQSQSEVVTLSFGEVPSGVAFTNQNNLLSIFDPGSLPQQAGIEWLLDGNVIPDENGDTYCIGVSGNYTVVVTDLATGCSGSFSQNINYNPSFPNCTTDANETAGYVPDLTIVPNPNNGLFTLQIETAAATEGELSVLDPLGRVLSRQWLELSVGETRVAMDLQNLPAGAYLLRWQSAEAERAVRALKLY